ncbi:DUF3604 domain-containing protein [Congregibacter sp.]|uniref:DUF3604 domain-containing protein n=1 Tax=Congregibacter sp. TaxID=2744308 RepID=UPI003F6D2158
MKGKLARPATALLKHTALVVAFSVPVSAIAEPSLAEQESTIAPSPLKDAYFGELHLHTSYSLDAYIGGARLTPSMAYRFAKGESMDVNGRAHNIGRPLDFAAVTDHAEYIGEMLATQVPGTPGYDNEKLDELRNLSSYEEQEAWFLREVVANSRGGGPKHTAFYPGDVALQNAWQLIVDAANAHYEPGSFTTLIGFEWSAAPKGGNMHRNVVFRDDKVPAAPFSSIDSPDEEQLWDWMQQQEAMGSSLLAIPHNSNASKGFMFEPLDNSENPIDAEYARLRSHFEPLIEMMQIKGNSEVHRKFWPADEFADFENGDSVETFSKRSFAKQNFVRAAVIEGLSYQRSLAANPYKLGFVGGTDSHNGTPGDVTEATYVGSHGAADGSIERRRNDSIPGWIHARDSSPGSITGVYAAKNTRGAIYDALRARETFVTSGPRIKPRFFAGANLPIKPRDARQLVERGYADGQPMGSTLTTLSNPPTFYVHALKDPEGANLDRIQVIKGWLDSEGNTQERIYDVAVSDDRAINEEGRCTTPVGNTVEVATATYENSIGATELLASWTDPDFDPAQPALYYTRTLEIPTPRWTTYDAARIEQAVLDDVPATLQERVWSSPIWYVP